MFDAVSTGASTEAKSMRQVRQSQPSEAQQREFNHKCTLCTEIVSDPIVRIQRQQKATYRVLARPGWAVAMLFNGALFNVAQPVTVRA